MIATNVTLFCSQKLPNGKVEERELVSCVGESFEIPFDMFIKRIKDWLDIECCVSEEFNFTLSVKL